MEADLNNTVVRPAVSSDADMVFRLLRQFATSYDPVLDAFEVNYPVLLEDNACDLLVAEKAGVVVGYVLASDSVTLFANGVVTELLELFVEETHRRQGIGRGLVEQAVANAGNRGSVEVTVPTRRAGPFYLSLGFELSAEVFKRRTPGQR